MRYWAVAWMLFQLVQNRGELLVVPPAGNFVERNIEDALLLLVRDIVHIQTYRRSIDTRSDSPDVNG